MSNTHILATLGPASCDEATIEALALAGATGFRLNFSHGQESWHRQTHANVRNVAKRLGRHIFILQDLQGPKIRVGKMEQPVTLVREAAFTLDADTTPGTQTRVHLPHPEILASLRVGDTIALNDGVIRLTVTETTGSGESLSVRTVVISGGILSSNKGVNVPGRELPLDVITTKDKQDMVLGEDLGFDWLALSFVQKAEDITAARVMLEKWKNPPLIMTKIETQAAIADLERIVIASDAIMIARGDLGVELPPEDVPPLQRRMLQLCRKYGKPAVVATQMLESMITNPVPTRAEASDVATAAYEQADCVMLSAESASGNHPVDAVATMQRIVSKMEQAALCSPTCTPAAPETTMADSVCAAAEKLAAEVGAVCIVAFTETGGTALRMSRYRPKQPIICLTPHADTARRMAVSWGLAPVIAASVSNTDEMVAEAVKAAKESHLAQPGQRILIVAGIPFQQKGTTNLLRIAEVA